MQKYYFKQDLLILDCNYYFWFSFEFQIITWRHYVLLVVVVEEHLEVYQFAKKTIAERTASPAKENMTPLAMDPIQQITLNGRYRELFLCEPSEDSVSLIVLVDLTKLYSHLK